MKKIIITLALCSMMLGLASCTGGGNADSGDDGHVGDHDDKNESTSEIKDTEKPEEKYHGGIADDIYNLPRDIRKGIRDAGRDVHDGLKNAEDNLRNGMNRGGTTYDNRDVIK